MFRSPFPRTSLVVLLALAACFPRKEYKDELYEDTAESGDSSPDMDDSSGGPDTEDTACAASPEICDGLDNDCDGAVDEEAADGTEQFADYDGDGYGDPATSTVSCVPVSGYVANDDDCDIVHASVNPGADEVCDGIDNDCDGTADVGATDAPMWYTDGDADGYGSSTASASACAQPPGTSATSTDCDDARGDIHPGASETDCADSTDYNCDGSTGYLDADGDTFPACEDCDDSRSDVSPAGTEVCDDLDADEDCNSYADNADITGTGAAPSGTTTFYPDVDADSYGVETAGENWCDLPVGFSIKSGDCDETNASVNPSVTETCTTVYDDDCDGDSEMASDASTWYPDSDGDLYGAEGAPQMSCTAPAGMIADGTDCDDGRASVNPGEAEVCDAIDLDEDCNGLADEADGLSCSSGSDADGDSIDVSVDCDDTDPTVGPPTTWYADADADGFGDAASTTSGCTAPVGYVADATDCDDTRGDIHPGGTEVCDALDADEDCNGAADEVDGLSCSVTVDADGDGVYSDADCNDADPAATVVETWHPDADADGWGSDAAATTSCGSPGASYTLDDSDCDDGNAAVSPDATEVCDDLDADEDCNGWADEADGLSCSATVDADGDGAYADTDCDDTDPEVYPGATELNTVKDEDCDGNPFQTATLTTLSGAVVTVISSTNGIDDESATFEAGTTGSWTEITDRLGTQNVADMGPYGVTWSATGGLAGGVYNGLALYAGSAAYTECDEKVGVSANVTSGSSYVLAFTARNMGASSNDIGVYVDGVSLGTLTIASGDESFSSADFTATASTATIWLCTGTVQGGVDATQFGVFKTL